MSHDTQVKQDDKARAHEIMLSGKSRYFDPFLEDAIAAALATVRREEREAAWQPIETAPKDGTEVLLVWHWNSGIHRGVSVVMASWYCRTHVHLSRSKDCPNEPDCKEGWGAYAGQMSHWMPKPDLPVLEASTTEKGELSDVNTHSTDEAAAAIDEEDD